MKMKHQACSLALFACLFAFAESAPAADLICNSGTFCDLPPLVDGDVYVFNGTLARVPQGGATVITGDVILFDHGSLSMRNGLVEGDVLASGADTVAVIDSTVDGDMVIHWTGAGMFSPSIVRTEIGGDLWLVSNDANNIGCALNTIGGDVVVLFNSALLSISISNNEIGGSLLAFANTAVDRILVLRNTILGDLLCGWNNPDPVVQNNTVSGTVWCEN